MEYGSPVTYVFLRVKKNDGFEMERAKLPMMENV